VGSLFKAGDLIAQLIIELIANADTIEVEDLGPTLVENWVSGQVT